MFLFDEHHNTDVQNEKERIAKLKAQEKESNKQKSQDSVSNIDSPPKSQSRGRGRPKKSVEREASPKSGRKTDKKDLNLDDLMDKFSDSPVLDKI